MFDCFLPEKSTKIQRVNNFMIIIYILGFINLNSDFWKKNVPGYYNDCFPIHLETLMVKRVQPFRSSGSPGESPFSTNSTNSRDSYQVWVHFTKYIVMLNFQSVQIAQAQ